MIRPLVEDLALGQGISLGDSPPTCCEKKAANAVVV